MKVKYICKCKETGREPHIVGVINRAQSLVMAKRKIVTRVDGPLVKFKRRCGSERNLAELATSTDNSNFDHVREISCCSSNGSASGLEQERVDDVDLVYKIHVDNIEEVETITCDLVDGYRSETTNSSELSSREMESPEKKSQPAKTPPDDEIKEFFAAAKKEQQKYFTDKYNYDFEKDAPLKGRYEWVLIKP